MPNLAYIAHRFSPASVAVIQQANIIITDYAAQGFDLTLRQLYYQFVSRGLIPNRDSEYKKLGSTINDARLAGVIDWNAIQDRTRNVRSLSHWDDPAGVIKAALASYHVNYWDGQTYRPEVWIEKDALVGVIAPACEDLDVPYFSCRGYTSQSEMWGAAQRLRTYIEAGQVPIIFHLGDHDPSGIDMTRDITDRLTLFLRGGYDPRAGTWETQEDPIELERLALNMEQVNQYDPPPNPAKLTDARAVGYIRIHGNQSWELDALEPTVIDTLIRDAVDQYRDMDKWDAVVAREDVDKTLLKKTSSQWDAVVGFLEGDA